MNSEEEDIDLDDLFSELEDIQKPEESQPETSVNGEENSNINSIDLTQSNVADLMRLLMDNKLFSEDPVYFTAQKEYVSESKLSRELFDILESLGGRASYRNLSELLSIDESIILKILKSSNSTDLVFLKDKIFSKSYILNLQSEILDLLSISGSITLPNLTKRYGLPVSFFSDYLIPKYISNTTNSNNIKIKKNFIYTSKYVQRIERYLLGFFTSLESPIKVCTSELSEYLPEEFHKFLESLNLKKLIKKQVSSGRIQGKFLSETYFPKRFDDVVFGKITSYLKHNCCISFDYIRNNILSFGKFDKKKLINFIKKNILVPERHEQEKATTKKKSEKHDKKKVKKNKNEIEIGGIIKYKFYSNCLLYYDDFIHFKVPLLVEQCISSQVCTSVLDNYPFLDEWMDEIEKEEIFEESFNKNVRNREVLVLGKGQQLVMVPISLIKSRWFNEDRMKDMRRRFGGILKSSSKLRNVSQIKERIKTFRLNMLEIAECLDGWDGNETIKEYKKSKSGKKNKKNVTNLNIVNIFGEDSEEVEFLRDVKDKIVVPMVCEYFKKYMSQNEALGIKYSKRMEDSERLRKLSMKKVERKISILFCFLSTSINSNFISTTSTGNSTAIENKIFREFVRYVCDSIVSMIEELKLMEFRISLSASRKNVSKLPTEVTFCLSSFRGDIRNLTQFNKIKNSRKKGKKDQLAAERISRGDRGSGKDKRNRVKTTKKKKQKKRNKKNRRNVKYESDGSEEEEEEELEIDGEEDDKKLKFVSKNRKNKVSRGEMVLEIVKDCCLNLGVYLDPITKKRKKSMLRILERLIEFEMKYMECNNRNKEEEEEEDEEDGNLDKLVDYDEFQFDEEEIEVFEFLRDLRINETKNMMNSATENTQIENDGTEKVPKFGEFELFEFSKLLEFSLTKLSSLRNRRSFVCFRYGNLNLSEVYFSYIDKYLNVTKSKSDKKLKSEETEKHVKLEELKKIFLECIDCSKNVVLVQLKNERGKDRGGRGKKNKKSKKNEMGYNFKLKKERDRWSDPLSSSSGEEEDSREERGEKKMLTEDELKLLKFKECLSRLRDGILKL